MDSLGSNLPMQSISIAVLKEKYAKGTEKDEDSIFKRVAKGLASVEKESLRKEFEEKFLTNMRKGAIGAGRIMSAAGSGIQATLINCFVQPVGDSIQGIDQEGMPGIYVALKEAAETMRRGGESDMTFPL
jgi:ribonucleoside-diphosphate reductase alpha chain